MTSFTVQKSLGEPNNLLLIQGILTDKSVGDRLGLALAIIRVGDKGSVYLIKSVDQQTLCGLINQEIDVATIFKQENGSSFIGLFEAQDGLIVQNLEKLNSIPHGWVWEPQVWNGSDQALKL